MESSRFDAFVRALDRTLSRRRTLAAMLAVAPVAPLSALETAGKGQRRRKKGKRRGGKGERRGGQGRGGEEPRGNGGSCDPAACAAAGGCCAGNTCVRGAGQWTPQTTFGRKGDGPGQFDRPAGVAISGDERTVWVADYENHRISVWTRTGDDWLPQSTFGRKGDGADQFDDPRGVAVSADGQTVWVADAQNHRISVWTKSAQGWSNQTTFGSNGSGPDQFNRPEGVAVSADGQTVWVAESNNDRISVWTRSGSGWVNQTTFGSRGRGPNQFNHPTGVAVSADGQTVWVAEQDNDRVSVWVRSGGGWVNQTTFGSRGDGPSQLKNPGGVAISGDGLTVWVADTGNDRISVWTRSGSGWVNLTTYGKKGDGLGEFDVPRGVAVSANGQTAWVVDSKNDRISVWARSPRIWSNQTTFGREGEGAGQFHDPRAVAVSANGQTAWIADLRNDRISVWAKSGNSWINQTTFGEKGDGPGELKDPSGVAVSADGQTVWVTDSGNSRISVWTRSGGSWLPQTTFGSRGSGLSEFRNPRGLAVSADGQIVWVADQDNDRISVWIRSGSGWVNLITFGDKGDGPGQFNEPWGVAVSADEQTVWVADEGNFRISVWTRSGNTWVNQTTFGGKGEELDQFDEPRGVAVSADGQTVWVGDFNNHRVSVWIKSGSGNWLPQTTFGGFGSAPNELRFPNGVALGADEQTVWVADTTNNRVSVWAPTCPPA